MLTSELEFGGLSMNSKALDFKSISIRVVCITTVAIAAVFLMLALTGCGPSNEERIEQAVSQPLEAIKAKEEATLTSFLSDDAKQQLSDIGIDPMSYISAYLDGFDYALGPINIDKDTATVDLTITCKTTDSIFAALEQKATEDFESGASANNTEEQTQSKVAENTLDLINAAASVQHDPITVTLHKIDKSWIVDSDINGALLKALQG